MGAFAGAICANMQYAVCNRDQGSSVREKSDVWIKELQLRQMRLGCWSWNTLRSGRPADSNWDKGRADSCSQTNQLVA